MADIARLINRGCWLELPPELRVKLRKEYRRDRDFDRRFLHHPPKVAVLEARARNEAVRNGMIAALDYARAQGGLSEARDG